MASSNKVRWGLSNVYFATRSESDQGVVTYASPVYHEGAVSLSITRSSSKSNFYADNKIFFTIFSKAAREGTLEMSILSDAVKTSYLGYVADSNGKLVETDAQGASFALLFQIEGDVTEKKYCIYNCTAAESDTDFKTIEDQIDPNTSSMSLSIVGETVGNRQCYIAEVASFDSVSLPTFPTPASI